MTRDEEWRKIILSINDNTFFDLMRNYLGKIETPFNKQDLMNRLVNFLSRADIRETLLALIDDEEARLLSAVGLTGGATESQLRSGFPGWTYLELLTRIGNLEERFLIYRRKGIYNLTPLFEEELKRDYISPSLLIETGDALPGFDPPLWFSDPLMIALYSFFCSDSNLIKIDGTVKKRGADKLEQLFPHVFGGEEGRERFILTLKILKNLNLLNITEGEISLNHFEWKRLSERTERDRYSLYYGAALADSPASSGSMTDFFIRFYKNFPPGRVILNDSLAPFFLIFCSIGPAFHPERVKKLLCDLNILVSSGEGLKLNGVLRLGEKGVPRHNDHPLIVQPNFEITVKQTASLKELLETAGALDLTQYDLYSRFSLSRKSFLRAFSCGLTPVQLIDDLEKLSGKEIPQNISISLDDWAREHEKVVLYKGTVMKVAEDKRIFIEKTDVLTPFIQEVLADGVYLMKNGFERQWMDALENLSITPRVIDSTHVKKEENGSQIPVKHLNWKSSSRNLWKREDERTACKEEDRTGELLKILDRSGIKGDEKKELDARIRRKLIFHPSQINKGIVRPEITEARGMNYQGKVRLVESALQNSSDRLELTYFSGGDSRTILVQPLELKKEENDKILEGRILPDEETITLRVSKISKIRKIRSSLF
ncbi:MAG: helicase-associated domain-containing protein [Spirochaetales bacterium]|nr:helicase-associated domain-containing protein [Spirochaetales bacterium]